MPLPNPAPLDVVGDIVPAFAHALADALPGDVEAGDPEEVEPDAVARGPRRLEKGDVAVAR